MMVADWVEVAVCHMISFPLSSSALLPYVLDFGSKASIIYQYRRSIFR
jgi:hypothetical protein